MANIHDVAAYILEQRGPMSAMKLQKLVYYSQAWHLVWDDEPLFTQPIQAWANGPVAPALYQKHRGEFSLSDWKWGDSGALTESQRESVDAVLGEYGDKEAFWLSELSHVEDPWREAREGLSPADRSAVEISHGAMVEYYSGL